MYLEKLLINPRSPLQTQLSLLSVLLLNARRGPTSPPPRTKLQLPDLEPEGFYLGPSSPSHSICCHSSSRTLQSGHRGNRLPDRSTLSHLHTFVQTVPPAGMPSSLHYPDSSSIACLRHPASWFLCTRCGVGYEVEMKWMRFLDLPPVLGKAA